MNNLQILRQLGLNEKQARLYLTALELGPSTILTLAKKSGVKRTSIYNFLNEMIERGFIVYTINGKKTLYSAIEPQGLLKIIDKQKELVSSAIPDLSLLLQEGGSIKPKIKFYEGIEGIKQVYNDTLKQPEGSSFVAFTAVSAAYDLLPNTYIKKYIQQRAGKKIFVKVIARDDELSRSYVKKNKEQLRETLLAPPELYTFENEINVYENKVAIVSYGDEKMGIIIESQQIADAMRAIFNTMWFLLKSRAKNKN